MNIELFIFATLITFILGYLLGTKQQKEVGIRVIRHLLLEITDNQLLWYKRKAEEERDNDKPKTDNP